MICIFCSDNAKRSRERSFLGESNSCSSSLKNKGSSQLFRERRRKITAVVTRCREIKLDFVQKRRSKTMTRWSSGSQETTLKKSAIGSVSETTTESSCLSSGSSGVTNVGSRSEGSGGGAKKGAVGLGLSLSMRQLASRRKPIVTGSAHAHRLAEAILKLLSGGGCASEVRIRQLLGDTPDTSKALRMLLKMEEVKRYGAGGRADPYIYRRNTQPYLKVLSFHKDSECHDRRDFRLHGGWSQVGEKTSDGEYDMAKKASKRGLSHDAVSGKARSGSQSEEILFTQ